MRIVRKDRDQGFTLVEMIGVLAVIAVLAAMLIPKIFEAINNSKINNTIESYNTLKTAVGDHYAKWGRFSTSTGVAITSTSGDTATLFDTVVLLAEGWIDKGFYAKIGSQTQTSKPAVRIKDIDGCGVGGSGSYALDGVNNLPDTAGTYVIEIEITGVAAADALALSKRLDGDGLSESDISTADSRGRVEYADPDTTFGIVTVYMYLAHR